MASSQDCSEDQDIAVSQHSEPNNDDLIALDALLDKHNNHVEDFRNFGSTEHPSIGAARVVRSHPKEGLSDDTASQYPGTRTSSVPKASRNTSSPSRKRTLPTFTPKTAQLPAFCLDRSASSLSDTSQQKPNTENHSKSIMRYR